MSTPLATRSSASMRRRKQAATEAGRTPRARCVIRATVAGSLAPSRYRETRSRMARGGIPPAPRRSCRPTLPPPTSPIPPRGASRSCPCSGSSRRWGTRTHWPRGTRRFPTRSPPSCRTTCSASGSIPRTAGGTDRPGGAGTGRSRGAAAGAAGGAVAGGAARGHRAGRGLRLGRMLCRSARAAATWDCCWRPISGRSATARTSGSCWSGWRSTSRRSWDGCPANGARTGGATPQVARFAALVDALAFLADACRLAAALRRRAGPGARAAAAARSPRAARGGRGARARVSPGGARRRTALGRSVARDRPRAPGPRRAVQAPRRRHPARHLPGCALAARLLHGRGADGGGSAVGRGGAGAGTARPGGVSARRQRER